MKADDENDLFGWKATQRQNFSLIDFFVDELLESKAWKILLSAGRGQI